MEKTHESSADDLWSQFKATNCTCSFCLLVFAMKDPTENDLFTFHLHLQRIHGLKVGEPQR